MCNVAADTKKALRNMVGLSDSNTIYESLRLRQIVNSEVKVESVTNVIEKDYFNPFGLDIDPGSLVNIASGLTLQNEIAEVLNQEKKGKELAKEFNGAVAKRLSLAMPWSMDRIPLIPQDIMFIHKPLVHSTSQVFP